MSSSDSAASLQLNLKIVKKIEPSIESIVFTGRHVVLYVFENDNWVRIVE